MTSQNVFLEKKYYITESIPDNIKYTTSPSLTSGTSTAGYGQESNSSLNSKWNSSCTSTSVITPSSSITTTKPADKQNLQNGKLNTTAFNILEVYEYITFLVNKFTTDYTLATSCDIDSRYKPTTGNGFQSGCCKGSDMQNSCTTFANFTDTSYIPSFSQSGDKYSSYKRLNINEFIYKESGKRSLCQQFNDISGLVNTFNDLLKNDLKDINSTTSSTQFQQIQASYSQMIQLRNKLDLQLQQLMNKGSISAQNKLQLDSTVYTTVLWTVLATSVLYYVFIKL